MQALITAIKSEADEITAITGGCYFATAPDNAAFPFAVFQVLYAPSTTIYGSVGKDPFEATVEWRVLDDTCDGCQAAMDAIKAKFDETLLTLSDSTNHHVLRVDEPFPHQILDINIDRFNAEKVWESIATYRYGVRKT